MKCAYLVLSIIGILTGLALAQTNSSEEFKLAFQAALQEKSLEKLNAISYLVGMSPSDKEQTAANQQMMFSEGEIGEIFFEPLPDNFPSVVIMNGEKLEPTYSPSGLITIKYKNKNGVVSSSAPYAIIDGHYFLVPTKSTDLKWNGPPDKTITFMVIGHGQDKVQIKAKWNASGVDQEQNFKSPSSNFLGQYFEEVLVTSTEDDTNVTLRILEDGKKIFVSEPLKGKGTIDYKKKS